MGQFEVEAALFRPSTDEQDKLAATGRLTRYRKTDRQAQAHQGAAGPAAGEALFRHNSTYVEYAAAATFGATGATGATIATLSCMPPKHPRARRHLQESL